MELFRRGGNTELQPLKKTYPIVKVDDQTHFVWGICTSETPGKDKEISDYPASKAAYIKWSDDFLAKTTAAGQDPSMGTIRVMRRLQIGGKAVKPEERAAAPVEFTKTLGRMCLSCGKKFAPDGDEATCPTCGTQAATEPDNPRLYPPRQIRKIARSIEPFGFAVLALINPERTGRTYHGTKLDLRYVDTTIRRWQVNARGSAVPESTFQKFQDIEGEPYE